MKKLPIYPFEFFCQKCGYKAEHEMDVVYIGTMGKRHICGECFGMKVLRLEYTI